MSTRQTAANAETDSSEDLRQQVDTLKEDLATLTRTLKRLAGERGNENLESLKSVAADAEARVRDMSGSMERKIVERPLMSLLVAFGVGMVIGKLFERR